MKILGTNLSEDPLHTTAKSGNKQTVGQIPAGNPEFVHDLNHEGYTSMHLATGRLLVYSNPETCLLKDKGRRIPLYAAALKEELIFNYKIC